MLLSLVFNVAVLHFGLATLVSTKNYASTQASPIALCHGRMLYHGRTCAATAPPLVALSAL